MFTKQKSTPERIAESAGKVLEEHGGAIAASLGAATLAVAGTIVGASALINAAREQH